LLIFFMMTPTISSGILAPIQTPETKYPTGVLAADQFWIGVDRKGPNGNEKKADGLIVPWYSLGQDKEERIPPTDQLDDFRNALTRQFAGTTGEVKIRLRADRSLPIETITGLISELQKLQFRLNRDRQAGATPLKLDLLGEVSEGQ
jgi:biopolymer transport protein ExbD